MNDADVQERLRRAPSLSPQVIRSALFIFDLVANNRGPTDSEVRGELQSMVARIADARNSISSLSWAAADAIYNVEGTDWRDEVSLSDLLLDLERIQLRAETVARHLGMATKAGRPVSAISEVVCFLADEIESAGGLADATKTGELYQAMGVVLDLAGHSVANLRETIRAALSRRPPKQ